MFTRRGNLQKQPRSRSSVIPKFFYYYMVLTDAMALFFFLLKICACFLIQPFLQRNGTLSILPAYLSYRNSSSFHGTSMDNKLHPTLISQYAPLSGRFPWSWSPLKTWSTRSCARPRATRTRSYWSKKMTRTTGRSTPWWIYRDDRRPCWKRSIASSSRRPTMWGRQVWPPIIFRTAKSKAYNDVYCNDLSDV